MLSQSLKKHGQQVKQLHCNYGLRSSEVLSHASHRDCAFNSSPYEVQQIKSYRLVNLEPQNARFLCISLDYYW